MKKWQIYYFKIIIIPFVYQTVTTCRSFTKLRYDITEYLYLYQMHEKDGQLQPVSNLCTYLIKPTVHMTFRLYSECEYCFCAF